MGNVILWVFDASDTWEKNNGSCATFNGTIPKRINASGRARQTSVVYRRNCLSLLFRAVRCRSNVILFVQTQFEQKWAVVMCRIFILGLWSFPWSGFTAFRFKLWPLYHTWNLVKKNFGSFKWNVVLDYRTCYKSMLNIRTMLWLQSEYNKKGGGGDGIQYWLNWN